MEKNKGERSKRGVVVPPKPFYSREIQARRRSRRGTKKLITCSIQSYQEHGGRLNYSVLPLLPFSFSLCTTSLSLSLSHTLFLAFPPLCLPLLCLVVRAKALGTEPISVFDTDEKTNRASTFLNRFRARPCVLPCKAAFPTSGAQRSVGWSRAGREGFSFWCSIWDGCISEGF